MRRIGMRAVGLVLTLLVATACGSNPGTKPDEARAYRGCTRQGLDDHGSVVARADLDGSGGVEKVRLVGPHDRRCGDSLVAVVGGRLVGADVGRLRLVAARAQVVHLRGDDHRDLLLLWSEPHPRGGSQPHLFGLRGAGRLAEVTVDGHPLLPFVVTDGGGSPATATCTGSGGIAVFSAVAHQPPGIVLAWDVTRTTYALRDGRADVVGSSLVEKAAADPALRRSRPELFSGRLFANCR